jgi:hypothetical protein
MAQEGPLTPEKQLLKLIEESKAPGGGVKAHAAKHRGLSFLSPGAWLGRLSFFKERVRLWGKGDKPSLLDVLDIKFINNALTLCAFLMAILVATNFTTSATNVKKMPSLKLKIKEAAKQEVFRETSRLQAPSYYLEKVRQRDIFKMGEKKEEESPEAAPKGPSQELLSATEHLKLVGIAWSNDPDAMIEDTKALRTFFVKRGQMIGEFKVQAIFRDKVVLRYRKEEVELK